MITDISDDRREENVEMIVDFLYKNQIRVVNVAGHRAVPRVYDYVSRVGNLLTKAFSKYVQLE